jgi:hypothetical protein
MCGKGGMEGGYLAGKVEASSTNLHSVQLS